MLLLLVNFDLSAVSSQSISLGPMEQPEIKICSPEMEQDGVFWVPMQQAEQGWDDFDLEISLESGTACRFQVTRIATAI